MGLVVLALCGIVATRPGWRKYKSWKALQHVAEARALVQSGGWESAIRPIQLALRLAPQNSEALRLTAQYCSHFNSIDGIGYWQMLIASGEATREDRLEYIRLSQSLGRVDLAGAELTAQMTTNASDQRVLLLGLKQVCLKQDWPAAFAFAREALNKHPDEPQVLWEAGQALIRHPDPEAQNEGRSVLWNLAIGQSAFQSRAVRLLAQNPNIEKGDIDVLLLKLRNSSTSNDLENQLLQGELELRLMPSRRAELVESVVNRFASASDSRERVAIAEWLHSQNAHEQLVKVFPIEQIRSDPALLQFHLQALADLQQWPTLQTHLNNSDLKLEVVPRNCLLALVDTQVNQSRSVEAYLGDEPGAQK